MDQDFASSIMDLTRDFYAGHGTKSGNKVYDKSKKELLSETEFDKRRTSFLVRMFSSRKTNKRYGAMKVSQQMRRFNPTGPTPYEYGKAQWSQGQGGGFITGNCGEMADVAAFLAIDQYNVPADEVYIGSIGAPGDHAFCLAGATSAPTWTSAQAMDAFTTGVYVIDPWLHVACASCSYTEFAQKMLCKWQRDGKRVCWSGADGTKLGWYDPSRSYLETFLTAPLTFVRAKP